MTKYQVLNQGVGHPGCKMTLNYILITIIQNMYIKDNAKCFFLNIYFFVQCINMKRHHLGFMFHSWFLLIKKPKVGYNYSRSARGKISLHGGPFEYSVGQWGA